VRDLGSLDERRNARLLAGLLDSYGFGLVA
jgi:hypothetical protein